MSVFRDFFTSLWNDYIGVKLDAITGKFKSEIGDKILFVTMSINGVKTFLDTKIGIPIKSSIDLVTTKIDEVKAVIVDIPTKIVDLAGKIADIDASMNKWMLQKLGFDEETSGFISQLGVLPLIKNMLSLEDTEQQARIGEVVGNGVKRGVKLVTDAALENLTPVFEQFMEDEKIPEKEREKIRTIAASGEFGLNSVVGFMLGHFLSPILSTSLAPAWEGMAQEAWKILPVRNVDPATLIRLKYKDKLGTINFEDVMTQHGYDIEAQTAMLDDFLWLPTVGDVIRWSVREAFYDDYALTYGLDKEYPGKLNEYGIKIGISEQELKYFWRSHWELPSIMMGYDMLHRTRATPMYSGQQPTGTVGGKPYYTVITDTDLDSLFMAADIMPFWRDKLKAISYHVYTRVDVRRLFRDSVISRDEVKLNYISQGYDEEHAEKLTAWTVQDTLAKEKDLTRSHIERLYKEGQLTNDKAIEDLVSLGYDREESVLLLMLIDLKLEDETEKDLIATWIDKFKMHLITLSALTANLGTLNLTVARTDRIIAKAERIESKFVTLPSKEDLSGWLKNDIIGADIFKTRMLGLGYTEVDIGYFIKEITMGESE